MKKFLNYKNLIVQKSMAIERNQVRDIKVMHPIALRQAYLLDEAIRSSFNNAEPYVDSNAVLPARVDAAGNDILERWQAIVFSAYSINVEEDITRFYDMNFKWSFINYSIHDNDRNAIEDYRRDFNITRGGERDLPRTSKINGGWITEETEEEDEDGEVERFQEYKFVVFTLKPQYVYHLKARWTERQGENEVEIKKLVETPYTKSAYVYPMIWGKEFFASVYSEYINLKFNENILSGINVEVGGEIRPITRNRTTNLMKEDVEALYRVQYEQYYSTQKRTIDFEVDTRADQFRKQRKENTQISPTYANLQRIGDDFTSEYTEILKDSEEQQISPFHLDERLNVSCYYAKDISCFMGASAGRERSGIVVGMNLPAYYRQQVDPSSGAIVSVNDTRMRGSSTDFTFVSPEKIQANTTHLYNAEKEFITDVFDVKRVQESDSGNTSVVQQRMNNVFRNKNNAEIDTLLRSIGEKLDRNSKYANINPGEIPEREYVDNNGQTKTYSDFKYLVMLQKYISELNELTPKTLEEFNEKLQDVKRENWGDIPETLFNLKQLILED